MSRTKRVIKSGVAWLGEPNLAKISVIVSRIYKDVWFSALLFLVARQTIPTELYDEVIDNIHILGKDGGYILAPCHNIQVVSPPENIVAMYETGYENGWY